jgi:acetyl esterase/lipase
MVVRLLLQVDIFEDIEKLTKEIHDLVKFLDPEVAEGLKLIPEWSLTSENLPFLREYSVVDSLPAPVELVIENFEVTATLGQHEIPVRIYRSTTLPKAAPVLIWMHGGGFVMGNVPKDDDLCIGMAQAGRCVVVSVDYRLAPEFPFPAAPEDCFAILEWVSSQPAELGVTPDRVAVGGVSAGGCLAASVALMTRDRNGPDLCHQFLFVPVTDDRLQSPSSLCIHDPRVWSRDKAVMAWQMYLGESHHGEPSPYAAPARANDLTGLPATTMFVEEYDLLHDEAVDYANRLEAAGVPVELKSYPGTFHAHFAFAPDAAKSKRTVSDMFNSVKRVFGA